MSFENFINSQIFKNAFRAISLPDLESVDLRILKTGIFIFIIFFCPRSQNSVKSENLNFFFPFFVPKIFQRIFEKKKYVISASSEIRKVRKKYSDFGLKIFWRISRKKKYVMSASSKLRKIRKKNSVFFNEKSQKITRDRRYIKNADAVFCSIMCLYGNRTSCLCRI